MQRTYRITDLADYINWPYLFHAWSLPDKLAAIAQVHGCEACRQAWVNSFGVGERPKAREAVRLFGDAQRMLSRLMPYVQAHAAFRLFEANADGDDILVYRPGGEVFRLPMLRQQHVSSDGFCWCLADFIRPVSLGERDWIGVFAVAVQNESPLLSASKRLESVRPDFSEADSYQRLLIQTLSDRLAEAAAEVLHVEVRRSIWGYAPDEHLSIEELHHEHYQGIRPAVGYPSLPDISLNFLLDELLDFSQVGIRLTEHGMMLPHAAVSGLMLANPRAHYFSVGSITEEQVADYARRRHMTDDEMRVYLRANLDRP